MVSLMMINHGNNHTQMLHGAGIFSYIWEIFGVNVGTYSSTMVRIWVVMTMGLS